MHRVVGAVADIAIAPLHYLNPHHALAETACGHGAWHEDIDVTAIDFRACIGNDVSRVKAPRAAYSKNRAEREYCRVGGHRAGVRDGAGFRHAALTEGGGLHSISRVSVRRMVRTR